MDPISILAAAALLWLAIGRGVSDIRYSGRGEMPPRTRERLAKLEAGRASGSTGPAVGRYVADLFDEAVERRQARRGNPKATPARNFLGRRWEGAWDGLEERIRERRDGPAGRHAVRPGQTVDVDPATVPTIPAPVSTRPPNSPPQPTPRPEPVLGERHSGPHGTYEWTYDGWRPVDDQPKPAEPTPTNSTSAGSSRNWDGSPETEAERRFHDLRESGYTGWINEDGYAVDGPTFQHTDPEDATDPPEPTNPAGIDPTLAAQLDDIHTGGTPAQPDGGTAMTASIGEAHTVEQIRANLSTAQTVAANYADQAQGAAGNAAQLAQQLENLSASATAQNANPAVLEGIAAMVEQAQRVQALAEQLAAAAADLNATAARTGDDLNRTDGLIEETAASVGHIGERGLYAH